MRFFILTLAVVSMAAFVCIREVTARYQQVELGFKITEADIARRDLEDQRQRLLIEQAELLDPTRIEPLAFRAGLSVPRPDVVIRVKYPKIIQDSESEANSKNVTKKQEVDNGR